MSPRRARLLEALACGLALAVGLALLALTHALVGLL